jgi:hypothetical protein
MLMMNDLGPMAAGVLPFDTMCGGLYEHQQQPPKPRFVFKMPRVVPDQKGKFESDELFRRLSRESDVSMRRASAEKTPLPPCTPPGRNRNDPSTRRNAMPREEGTAL